MSDFVTGHYGPRANDYVSSQTHAVGEDLERLVALLREETPGVALDLGCGGGHVSYARAPFCGQVVAYDPTLSMANAVRNEAERRGLTRGMARWTIDGQIRLRGAECIIRAAGKNHQREEERG